MKCVLRIGYMEILLPDDKGVGKLIETLSKGVECSYRSYEKTCEIRDEIEVSVKILPASTRIEVREEMLERMEETFRMKAKPGAKLTPRVAGRSQLLLIGSKDRS